jgi:hypothetical protein
MAEAASAGLAPVADKSLQTKETGRYVAEILNDPNQTNSLLMVTRYYRDFYEDFWSACYQLSTYEDLTYLVDFDILREYLEVDSVQHFGSLILDSLFTESNKKYAIPAGAFNELFDYMKKLARTNRSLGNVDSSDPTTFVRQMAAFMGLEDARDAEIEDLGERTKERLSNTSIRLKKLYDIFNNPRFLGVASDSDSEDVRALEAILHRMPRPPDVGRDKRDHRDAVNLAIAIKSVRGQEPGKKSGYILLTNTKIVQKLPTMILENVMNPSQRLKILNQLSDILGIREADKRIPTLEGPDFSLDFPAMHASSVINAEIQGVFENSTLIMEKAIKLQNEFQLVNNYLKTQATASRRAGAMANPTVMTEIRRDLTDELTQSLKAIADEMLSVRAKGQYRIEQRRATAVSVAFARQQQKGGRITIQDKITEESTALLKTFGQVLAAIEGTSGFRYVVDEEPANDSRPFGVFKILQEPAPDGHEPIAVGEKYLIDDSDFKPAFFTIRWPVASRPEQFLNAMRRLVLPLVRDKQADMRADKDVFVLKRVGDPGLRDEGVIVFANDRPFGCRLSGVLGSGRSNNWSNLNLKNITPLVKSILDEEAREQGHNNSLTPRLQQYRVNTKVGDFIFDIEPCEGESRRYFTIISHCDISRHIALLYSWTGLLYVFPDKLAKELSDLFGDFETATLATMAAA